MHIRSFYPAYTPPGYWDFGRWAVECPIWHRHLITFRATTSHWHSTDIASLRCYFQRQVTKLPFSSFSMAEMEPEPKQPGPVKVCLEGVQSYLLAKPSSTQVPMMAGLVRQLCWRPRCHSNQNQRSAVQGSYLLVNVYITMENHHC